jgi:sortase (surface protein transpeptidase)
MPLVVSAVPSSMSVPALGLTAPVRTMDESACPVLKPPTLNDAYWVGCRAKPGTDSDGTVFIIGHSRTGGPAVFNGLQGMKVGDAVEVTTPSGSLTYRVQHTTDYAKFGEVQSAPEVLERVPGRLVLVTCLLGPDGTSTDQNFVVQAELSAARR